MAETCKVIAVVTIDGLALMGKSPAMATYFCASSAAYFAPSAPYVCAAATGAHIAGRILQGDAAKGIAKKLTEKSCDLVIEVSSTATRLIVVKGKGTVSAIQREANNAIVNIKAATSTDGMIRLMNALGR